MATRAFLFAAVTLVGCVGLDEQDKDKDGTGESQQAVTDTTQTQSIAASVGSSSQDLGGFPIDGIEPATLSVFHLHVDAQAKWNATINTDVTWDSDKVRQGQTLDVARVASSTTGKIKVLWTLTGVFRPLDLFDVNIGTIPISLDVDSCSPNLDSSAGTFGCSAESDGISLLDTPGIPASPWVELRLGADFTITPNGATATRTVSFDNVASPSSDLDVTPSTAHDSVAMPCDKPVGADVQYALDPYHWAPAGTAASQQPHFAIGIRDPVIGAFKITLFDGAFGNPTTSSPDFELDGAGASLDFGGLLANNVLPTIAPLGPFSGSEGSPVHFSASTTSACPITSYVWNFSDGTTSFGPSPQRTFGDDGVFSGELTVTDSTHLSAAGDFSVNIANVPPVPNAGPDTSGAWNQPIAFHGQAVDPGFDDQATLTYTWNWGDGTPGSGGADNTHAYAVPGNYVATLTVCDDHVCVPAITHVHVRARSTFVAYTGANTGVFGMPVSLGGSIVDELGQPVVGGSLAFTLAGNPAGSALTNASGNGSTIQTVSLGAGSYPVSVAYAGSLFYVGGGAGGTLTVARMPSTIVYTGATTGGSNKTVALSAKLTDAFGGGLVGRTVNFTLGTQTASAVTGAGGVASTTLKLNQHNGSYSLTAAWVPSGADATEYSGATTSTTFSIGGK
jgi:hypothetical protein